MWESASVFLDVRVNSLDCVIVMSVGIVWTWVNLTIICPKVSIKMVYLIRYFSKLITTHFKKQGSIIYYVTWLFIIFFCEKLYDLGVKILQGVITLIKHICPSRVWTVNPHALFGLNPKEGKLSRLSIEINLFGVKTKMVLHSSSVFIVWKCFCSCKTLINNS